MKRVSKNTKGEIIAGLKAKLATLEIEIKNDVSIPIVASFGFLVALVWRDAIKAAIDEFLLRSGMIERAYFYNFISAIIVTIIVITIMIVITRFSRSSKTKKIKEHMEAVSKKLKKE